MSKLFVVLLAIAGLIALVQWRAGVREGAAEAAYPPIGQIIDVDGVKVHARVMGNPNRTRAFLLCIQQVSRDFRGPYKFTLWNVVGSRNWRHCDFLAYRCNTSLHNRKNQPC